MVLIKRARGGGGKLTFPKRMTLYVLLLDLRLL